LDALDVTSAMCAAHVSRSPWPSRIAAAAAPRRRCCDGFKPVANVPGFVALAAPAGVGVREAVLISGYGAILGSGGALGGCRLARGVAHRGSRRLGVGALWVLKRRRGALPTA
jgi:hypothetical protein